MLSKYIGLYSRNVKRDSSVELLRVYACFMVILAHIQLSYVVGEGNVDSVILGIKCLIADNVPIFFTILGFFFFSKVQGEDRLKRIPGVFGEKIKGFIVRVYIPTIIVTLICVFAFDIIYKNEEYSVHWELLTGYIFKQSPQDMVGQFWYIIDYVKLLILFPLFALVCVDERKYNIIRRSYMALVFLVVAINDISFLTKTESFVDLSKYVPNINVLFIFVGYEVYLLTKKESVRRRTKAIIGLILFLVGFFLRYSLTMISFNQYGVGNADHFMVMECAPAYLCAGGLLLLFVELFKGIRSGIIQLIGEMTLYVFMLHGMFMRILGEYGGSIMQSLNEGQMVGVYAVLYYLLYGGLLFVASFVLGLVIREIYGLIRMAFAKCFVKNEG